MTCDTQRKKSIVDFRSHSDLITHLKMATVTTHQYPSTSTQRKLTRIQFCFIIFLVTMAIIWLFVDTKIKCTVITLEPVVVAVYLRNFQNHSKLPSYSKTPYPLNDIQFKNFSLKTTQKVKLYSERQGRSAIFKKAMDKARKAWKEHKKRESSRYRNLMPRKNISKFRHRMHRKHISFQNESIKQHKKFIAEEMSKEFSNISSTFADGGTPIRNIILTTWRSGSTFIGSVIDSHPGMFYDYEPLLYLGENQVKPGPEEDESLQVINQIFTCDYSAVVQTQSEYLSRINFKLKHQTRLEKHCRRNTKACNNPKFLTEICKLSPYLVVKTVRLRAQMGEKLLNKTDNLRLLLLIRDPRGIMRSRMEADWCKLNERDCSSVQKLCGYMEDDLEYAKNLRNKYPDRFMAVRYEDVVLKPWPAFQKIFQFFRLRITDKVKKFIVRKVNIHRTGESFAFKWKREFATKEKFVNVISIQNNCSKVMDWWGYKIVRERNELWKMYPLLSPPWPEMVV